MLILMWVSFRISALIVGRVDVVVAAMLSLHRSFSSDVVARFTAKRRLEPDTENSDISVGSLGTSAAFFSSVATFFLGSLVQEPQPPSF